MNSKNKKIDADIKAQIARQGAELTNMYITMLAPIIGTIGFLIVSLQHKQFVCMIYRHYDQYVNAWPYNIVYLAQINDSNYDYCDRSVFLLLSFINGLLWCLFYVSRIFREIHLTNSLYRPPLFSVLILITLFCLLISLFGFHERRTLFGFSYSDSITIACVKLIIYQFFGFFSIGFTMNVGFIAHRFYRSGAINKM